MIYSLSYKRMDLYRFERNLDGKRTYYYKRVSPEILERIRKSVGYAIGLFPKEY